MKWEAEVNLEMLRVHYGKVVLWKSASHLDFQELVLSVFVRNPCSVKVTVRCYIAPPSLELAETGKVNPVLQLSFLTSQHPFQHRLSELKDQDSEVFLRGVPLCRRPNPRVCTGTVQSCFLLLDISQGHINFSNKWRLKEASPLQHSLILNIVYSSFFFSYWMAHVKKVCKENVED